MVIVCFELENADDERIYKKLYDVFGTHESFPFGESPKNCLILTGDFSEKNSNDIYRILSVEIGKINEEFSYTVAIKKVLISEFSLDKTTLF